MDFSGAVGLAIRVLKTAYQGVLRGVESQNSEVSVAVASGVDYSLILSSLRRSITHFKNTLREIQGDYNRLVEADLTGGLSGRWWKKNWMNLG